MSSFLYCKGCHQNYFHPPPAGGCMRATWNVRRNAVGRGTMGNENLSKNTFGLLREADICTRIVWLRRNVIVPPREDDNCRPLVWLRRVLTFRLQEADWHKLPCVPYLKYFCGLLALEGKQAKNKCRTEKHSSVFDSLNKGRTEGNTYFFRARIKRRVKKYIRQCLVLEIKDG